MAEGDRRRLAAVLAADADLQVLPRFAAVHRRHLDELADAGPVEELESYLPQELLRDQKGSSSSCTPGRIRRGEEMDSHGMV